MKFVFSIILFFSLSHSSCDGINISGKNISTIELLQRVVKRCSLSLFVKDEYSQKVLEKKHKLLLLNDFTLDKLLNTILEDLFFENRDGVLSIFSKKSKTFKIDYITSERNGKSSISASVQKDVKQKDENSIVSIEKFDFWGSIEEDISSILKLKSSDNSLVIDKNAGIIIIEANKKSLNLVSSYITLLKQRLSKQVLLSLSIVSVSLNKEHSSGIDWSKFSLSINSQNRDVISASGNDPLKLVWNNSTSLLSSIDFSMQGLISFLQTQGETKVVSSPKLLSINNQQALITIGDNINYQILKKTGKNQLYYEDKTLFIGILLNILAQISDSNDITLRINPSISRFKYQEDDVKQQLPRNLPPDTTQKKLSAVVKLKNNQTLILGGLMNKSLSNVENGVPLLKNIPLLGKLFSSTKELEYNNDLIFVINAKIVED